MFNTDTQQFNNEQPAEAKPNNKILIIIVAVLLVLIVGIVIFLVLKNTKKEPVVAPIVVAPEVINPNVLQTEVSTSTIDSATSTIPEAIEKITFGDTGEYYLDDFRRIFMNEVSTPEEKNEFIKVVLFSLLTKKLSTQRSFPAHSCLSKKGLINISRG
jgi:hypothetical protein